MSRSARLFDLLQVLRRHRHPVSGQTLADATGVSLRTLYRDIASLQAQGAEIDGEPGLGYVLKPGFMLPPLMFPPEEIEALVLGMRWVARNADDNLQGAARNALARIAAVLPADLRQELENTTLLIGPGTPPPAASVDIALLRQAIREERKLAIAYSDRLLQQTQRLIWPFALAFFDNVRVLIGWCETRQDFRHFRIDRIGTVNVLDQRYPRRRASLLRQWRQAEDIPEPEF